MSSSPTQSPETPRDATAAPAAGSVDLAALCRTAAADVTALQREICSALEAVDGRATFRFDRWERPSGGGGLTAVLQDGAIFEKAGVNTSEVFGEFSPEFAATMPGDGLAFYATGVSLVLHPRNPYIPTTHANFRFLRRGSAGWFGGGADLTPYYPFFDDAVHFHRVLHEACAAHDPSYYPRFKAWCDEYFFLRHRGETRGIGGLFFDYLSDDLSRTHRFWRSAGAAFLPAYLPIVQRHQHKSYGERERQFQLYRRGRYVEFNLLYDRGTMFGLKTDGRVESILMSLPPLCRWEYDFRPEPGSPEAELTAFLRPRDWLAEAAAATTGRGP